MQIVIDISDELYTKRKGLIDNIKAFCNYTVLPKGHGRLIKEKDAIEAVYLRDRELQCDLAYIKKNGNIDVLGVIKHIKNVPTVLEADEED